MIYGVFADENLYIKDADLNINVGETQNTAYGLMVNENCTLNHVSVNIDMHQNTKANALRELIVWRTLQLNNKSVLNIEAAKKCKYDKLIF